ncbi:MAG: 4Fe-4S dicluster domain-containing protein [Gemmatimonadota bacterium]|jgi:molybdopterin-containing oxidoreductase family iron-sulfur binding subunit
MSGYAGDSRRDFLKKLGLGTLGAGLGAGAGLPLLDPVRVGGWQGASPAEGPAVPDRQWAMVIDVEKCLRDDVRRACVEACEREHNIPRIPDPEEEIQWIRSQPFEHVLPEQVHERTPAAARHAPVLVLCNHCTDPPCTKVCPTEATWKRESDGIVMMDMHRCIGCRYCMAACPYGARSFNWSDPRDHVATGPDGELPSDYPTRTVGVVEKCTFCSERLRDGRLPACVEAAEAVPGGEGALTFGDLGDPDSPVSRLLRERTTVRRRQELGTGPNVYYVVPADLPIRAERAHGTPEEADSRPATTRNRRVAP